MNDAITMVEPLEDDDYDYRPQVGPRVYLVPASSIETMNDKFAKLQKRAKRLNIAAPSVVEVGSSFMEYQYRWIETDNYGNQTLIRNWTKNKNASHIKQVNEFEPTGQKYTGAVRTVHYFALVGVDEVKLAGWEFVATLDLELGADNLILRTVPGKEVPEAYRTGGESCEHCNTIRKRNRTFVIRHESGQHKRVGGDCIRDFLGHDADRMLSMFDQLMDVTKLMEAAEDEFGESGSKEPKAFDLVTFLAWTAKSIREDGWVSRTEARDPFSNKSATADRVLGLISAYAEQKE